MTGLDLREGDKRWLAILEGMHDDYDGEAINPANLSLLERWMGYGKNYNPSNSSINGGGSGSGSAPPTPTKSAAAAQPTELASQQ